MLQFKTDPRYKGSADVYFLEVEEYPDCLLNYVVAAARRFLNLSSNAEVARTGEPMGDA